MAHRTRTACGAYDDDGSSGATPGRIHPDRERRIFSRVNDTPIRNRGNRDGRDTTTGRGRGDEQTEEILLNNFRNLVIKGVNFNEVRRAAEAYFRIYLRSAREPKTTLD